MSEPSSRRDLLKNVALAATLGGLEPAAAQHVHGLATQEKAANGKYSPKVFKEGEWQSVTALAETICPGASKGGAAEFVDLLCSANPRLAATWNGGLAWMTGRLGKPFHAASPVEQTALLDKIAFKKNSTAELAPGITFFDLARRMVIDAYYTSAAGVAELGYKGNVGMAEFQVPKESLEYARKRSGLA